MIPIQKYKIPEEKQNIKQKSGIYLLISNGEIDYIGRSVNIYGRLFGTKHHVLNREKHDEIWICELDLSLNYKYHEIEDELIKYFSPPKNKAGLPRKY